MDIHEKPIKKHSPEKRWLQGIYISLCTFYTVSLTYIFFFTSRRWTPFSKRSIHLVPFREKTEYFQSCAIHTRPENIEFYKDFIGNILVFVPFPFLLCYVLAIKSYRKLLLISVATSLAIEMIQYICNIGVADIDDLLLNSIGASIGLLMLHIVSLKNNNTIPTLRGMQRGSLSY